MIRVKQMWLYGIILTMWNMYEAEEIIACAQSKVIMWYLNDSWFLKFFSEVSFMLILQLTLEQCRFVLCEPIYTWIFFNPKYYYNTMSTSGCSGNTMGVGSGKQGALIFSALENITPHLTYIHGSASMDSTNWIVQYHSIYWKKSTYKWTHAVHVV